jgi:hypothetical protein
MIAAFVLIVGNADCTAIVQTLVTGLYPESVVGILKAIVFGLLTAPLTCNCSIPRSPGATIRSYLELNCRPPYSP